MSVLSPSSLSLYVCYLSATPTSCFHSNPSSSLVCPFSFSSFSALAFISHPSQPNLCFISLHCASPVWQRVTVALRKTHGWKKILLITYTTLLFHMCIKVFFFNEHVSVIYTNIQIFLINLKRRLDRRTRMLKTMASLGLHATLADAVDGK